PPPGSRPPPGARCPFPEHPFGSAVCRDHSRERAAWDPQTEPTAPNDVDGARSSRLNKVSVSTLCTSKAEFISKFGPFLDESTIFFASKLPLVMGQAVAFAMSIKDSPPMLEDH